MTESTQRSTSANAKAAVPLEMFTDEEMAILAGENGVVVTPFLDRIRPDQRPAVDRTAFRSLIARGVLDPPSAEALARAAGTNRDSAAVELPVREDVRAMVTLRTSAAAVIAVARTTATGQDFWYAHIVAKSCLLEQVGSDGMHRFALSDSAGLPDALLAAALHPDAGDGVGEPLHFDPSPEATPPARIVDALGEAQLRADIVVRISGADRPRLVGAFTGPEGSWLFHCTFGSGEPVLARPGAADDLREELRALVFETLGRIGSQVSETRR